MSRVSRCRRLARATAAFAALTATGCAYAPSPRVTLRRPTVYRLFVGPSARGEPSRLAFGGAQRFRLEGARAVAIDGGFAAPIAAVARTGTRWLFASTDGVVAQASDFSAPLTRLFDLSFALEHSASSVRGPWGEGAVALQPWAPLVSNGALPLLPSAGDPRLLVVDARGHLHEHPLDATPVDAHFSSERDGLAVLDSGELACTSDAGARWQTLSLEADRAIALVADDSVADDATVLVRGLRSLFRVRAGCAGVDRVVARTARRAPGAPSSARVHVVADGVRFDEGRTIAEVSGDSLVIRDGLTGTVLRRDSLPARAACTTQRFGSGAVLACVMHAPPRGGELLRVDLLTRDAPPRPLVGTEGITRRARHASVNGPTAGLLLDGRGRSVLFDAPCAHTTRERDPVLCRVDRDGTQHELRVETRFDALAYRLGDTVLAWRLGAQLEGRPAGVLVHQLVGFDVFSGALIAVDRALADPNTRVEVSASSTLYGVTGPDEAPVLLIGSDPRRLARRALPAGVRGVGFIDERRGVAYGTRASTLFDTIDGGQHWRPLTASLLGAPGTVRMHAWREASVERVARCTHDECTIGGTLTVAWSGPYASAAPLLVRAASPLDEPARAGDAVARHRLGPYVSRDELCAAPTPSVNVSEERDGDDSETRFVLAPGLNMPCATTGDRWTCAFEGDRVTATGLVAGQRFVLALPPIEGGTPLGREEGFRLVGSGPGGVVLQRNSNGAAQRVFIGEQLRPAWLDAGAVRLALEQRDGARAQHDDFAPYLVLRDRIVTAVRVEGLAERAVVLVRYRPDGALDALSSPVPLDGLNSGWLATRGSEVGWLAPGAALAVHYFWPFSGSRPTRVPFLWPRDVRFCSAAQREGALGLLLVPSPNYTPGAGYLDTVTATAVLAWSEQGSCVLALHSTPWQTRAAPSGLARTWERHEETVSLAQQQGPQRAPSRTRCSP